MIAVDTNVLVHAHRGESSFHEPAARALGILAECGEAWAIPWPCVHEFLAVVTNAKAFRSPTPLGAAIKQAETWVSAPTLVLLHETDRHWPTLVENLRVGKVRGGLAHDARIAALCLEHGVRELWTADRDFQRFPALATFNPLTDDVVHEAPARYAAAKRARAAGRRRALAGS